MGHFSTGPVIKLFQVLQIFRQEYVKDDPRTFSAFISTQKVSTLTLFARSQVVEIVDNVSTAKLPGLKAAQYCPFCRYRNAVMTFSPFMDI